jgi:putative tryptophan/tyrosine transport system substrate-binding protein
MVHLLRCTSLFVAHRGRTGWRPSCRRSEDKPTSRRHRPIGANDPTRTFRVDACSLPPGHGPGSMPLERQTGSRYCRSQVRSKVLGPVEIGLVSNLARPGGNVTGVTGLGTDKTFGKRLQLATQIIPSLTRIAVLLSTEQNRFGRSKAALATAAKVLGVELHDLEVQAPSELEGAIRNAKDQGAQALYIWPNGFNYSFAKQISDMANSNSLPSIYPFREGALAGGLASYGADVKDLGRPGAAHVDKILRGTPPGTLPVEQLSKYELLINLKTAKALGIDVPASLLALADEVIE